MSNAFALENSNCTGHSEGRRLCEYTRRDQGLDFKVKPQTLLHPLFPYPHQLPTLLLERIRTTVTAGTCSFPRVDLFILPMPVTQDRCE